MCGQVLRIVRATVRSPRSLGSGSQYSDPKPSFAFATFGNATRLCHSVNLFDIIHSMEFGLTCGLSRAPR